MRSRDARGGFAEAIDPKALDEQAARGGAAEFDRFRKEFLAAGRSFRDPSGDYLDLLRRLQTIDNARRSVAVHENLSKLFGELIQGEAAGLTQLDVRPGVRLVAPDCARGCRTRSDISATGSMR